ncbi:MAG: shikimate kinase [Eubacteriales bacterium]|nr:shikimate kinase [Eubacteriales bacterium]
MGAMPYRIFLIGYMGSGKTTVSKILSRKTGVSWIDMDQEIEKAEGMPIRKMFIKYGEHEFRNKEAELLDKLCHVSSALDVIAGESTGIPKVLDLVSKYESFANREDPLIVSCGGGIILDELNRKILNRQYTIFLEAAPEMLFGRVKGDTNRPFAFMDTDDEKERIRKFLDLYQKREPLYKEAACVTIKIEEKNPEEIAEEILNLF